MTRTPDLDQWRVLASKELKGADPDTLNWETLEGITVKPLYTQADTAGLDVPERVVQRVSTINPKFLLGKGKLAEIEIVALRAGASLLVFIGVFVSQDRSARQKAGVMREQEDC